MIGLSFEVRGIPLPTKLNRGGKGVYQDAAVKQWMSLVREAAEDAMIESDWKTLRGPCRVDIHVFVLRRGKGKKRWHTQKPDADNFRKPILDAMTQARVYRDDCLVAAGDTTKEWAAIGAELGPEHGLVGCEVLVSALEE